MKQYSTYEAKSKLSQLIKESLAGEKVIIAYRDVPQVVLMPLNSKKRSKRKLGFLKEPVVLSEDFDEELPDFKEYMP